MLACAALGQDQLAIAVDLLAATFGAIERSTCERQQFEAT
jgi:hypothetical protein